MWNCGDRDKHMLVCKKRRRDREDCCECARQISRPNQMPLFRKFWILGCRYSNKQIPKQVNFHMITVDWLHPLRASNRIPNGIQHYRVEAMQSRLKFCAPSALFFLSSSSSSLFPVKFHDMKNEILLLSSEKISIAQRVSSWHFNTIKTTSNAINYNYYMKQCSTTCTELRASFRRSQHLYSSLQFSWRMKKPNKQIIHNQLASKGRECVSVRENDNNRRPYTHWHAHCPFRLEFMNIC